MRITTENGHSYELSETAITALQNACHAGEAETVFEKHASHVPTRDRCGIWQVL